MSDARARTKLLMVDDDAFQREYVRAIVKEDNFEFLEATDAIEGLEKAVANLPQLIVVDMRMSKMSGLEFIKTARANPTIAHIPIVVATAMSSSSVGFECLQSGAAAFFEKPLDPEPFLRKIKELLGHPLDPK